MLGREENRGLYVFCLNDYDRVLMLLSCASLFVLLRIIQKVRSERAKEMERLRRIASQRKSYQEVTSKHRIKHLKQTVEFALPFQLFFCVLILFLCLLFLLLGSELHREVFDLKVENRRLLNGFPLFFIFFLSFFLFHVLSVSVLEIPYLKLSENLSDSENEIDVLGGVGL